MTWVYGMMNKKKNTRQLYEKNIDDEVRRGVCWIKLHWTIIMENYSVRVLLYKHMIVIHSWARIVPLCTHWCAILCARLNNPRWREQPSTVLSPAVRSGLQDRTIFFSLLLFLAVVVVADWTKPNIIFHGLVSSCPWTLDAVWIRWGRCENKKGTLQQRALTVMI